MRHVAETFLESTLRRGKSLEQFLGGLVLDAEQSVRWIELRPINEAVELWDFIAPDLGDAHNLDLYEFIGAEEGLLVATLSSPADALAQAQGRLGASREHWVNQFVIQDEYHDYIAAGRPTVWPCVVV